MFEPNIAKEIRKKIDAVFYDGRVVPAHTENEHFYKDSEDGEVYASVTTKTSLLSRKYYKQMAADKAVEYIQKFLLENNDPEPEEIGKAFANARYQHEADLNQAGIWGTHGHDLIDAYMQDWIKNSERPQDINTYADQSISPQGICAGLGALKFFDDYTLFPIASEKKVISKKHRYGGTLDSLWLVGEVWKERIGDSSCSHTWGNKGEHVKCMKCGREEKLVLSLLDWKTSNQIFGYGSMGKYDYAMQVAAYAMALKEMAKVTCKSHWIVRFDKKEPKYEIGVIQDIKKAGEAFLAMNVVNDFARSHEAPILPLVVKKQRMTL